MGLKKKAIKEAAQLKELRKCTESLFYHTWLKLCFLKRGVQEQVLKIYGSKILHETDDEMTFRKNVGDAVWVTQVFLRNYFYTFFHFNFNPLKFMKDLKIIWLDWLKNRTNIFIKVIDSLAIINEAALYIDFFLDDSMDFSKAVDWFVEWFNEYLAADFYSKDGWKQLNLFCLSKYSAIASEIKIYYEKSGCKSLPYLFHVPDDFMINILKNSPVSFPVHLSKFPVEFFKSVDEKFLKLISYFRIECEAAEEMRNCSQNVHEGRKSRKNKLKKLKSEKDFSVSFTDCLKCSPAAEKLDSCKYSEKKVNEKTATKPASLGLSPNSGKNNTYSNIFSPESSSTLLSEHSLSIFFNAIENCHNLLENNSDFNNGFSADCSKFHTEQTSVSSTCKNTYNEISTTLKEKQLFDNLTSNEKNLIYSKAGNEVREIVIGSRISKVKNKMPVVLPPLDDSELDFLGHMLCARNDVVRFIPGVTHYRDIIEEEDLIEKDLTKNANLGLDSVNNNIPSRLLSQTKHGAPLPEVTEQLKSTKNSTKEEMSNMNNSNYVEAKLSEDKYSNSSSSFASTRTENFSICLPEEEIKEQREPKEACSKSPANHEKCMIEDFSEKFDEVPGVEFFILKKFTKKPETQFQAHLKETVDELFSLSNSDEKNLLVNSEHQTGYSENSSQIDGCSYEVETYKAFCDGNNSTTNVKVSVSANKIKNLPDSKYPNLSSNAKQSVQIFSMDKTFDDLVKNENILKDTFLKEKASDTNIKSDVSVCDELNADTHVSNKIKVPKILQDVDSVKPVLELPYLKQNFHQIKEPAESSLSYNLLDQSSIIDFLEIAKKHVQNFYPQELHDKVKEMFDYESCNLFSEHYSNSLDKFIYNFFTDNKNRKLEIAYFEYHITDFLINASQTSENLSFSNPLKLLYVDFAFCIFGNHIKGVETKSKCMQNKEIKEPNAAESTSKKKKNKRKKHQNQTI